MKNTIITLTISLGLILTMTSFTTYSSVNDNDIIQQEEEKVPKEYVKLRYDHDKKQNYLKNKHNSKSIVVKIPRCKLPVANCIGGPTSSITVVVDPGSREYLPRGYSFYRDKITAKFE